MTDEGSGAGCGTSSEQKRQVRRCRHRTENDSSNVSKPDSCSGDQRHDHRAVFNIVTRLKRVVPMIEYL